MLVSVIKKNWTPLKPQIIWKLNLAYIKLEAGNSSFNNHTSNTSDVESMQIEPDQLFNNEENSNKSHNSSRQGMSKS